MQSLQHSLIESTLHRILPDNDRLLSLHLEDILDNIIQELHRFFLLLQPFSVVLLIWQPHQQVEKQLYVLLFVHVDGTEDRETGETGQLAQVLDPSFALLLVVPVLHAGDDDLDHFLQSLQFLECFEDGLLGDEFGGLDLLRLSGYFLNRCQLEQLISIYLNLDNRLTSLQSAKHIPKTVPSPDRLPTSIQAGPQCLPGLPTEHIPTNIHLFQHLPETHLRGQQVHIRQHSLGNS